MTQTMTPPGLPARQNGNGNGGAMQKIDPRKLATDTGTLKALMEAQAEKLRMVLPKHLSPDRLMRVVLVAVSKSELLQKCSISSILQCVMTSAQLGLDCSGVLGSAYMVPFWNKNLSCYEAQLIPGYRGLIDLARRSGEIEDINAHCVYSGDEFDLELGAEPKLRHKPDYNATRTDSDIVGAYMVAYLKGNTRPHIEFVPRSDIDKVRGASKAGQRGPWVDWFAEMCRKTAVKRGIKYLPMSVELAEAVTLDNDAIERTEVLSAQTNPTRGADAILNRITSRPVSEGQTLVNEETGEVIDTPSEIVPGADPGVVAVVDADPGETPISPREQFMVRFDESCDAAEIPNSKERTNALKKWALKSGMVGKEHEASEEAKSALFDAIKNKSGFFAFVS